MAIVQILSCLQPKAHHIKLQNSRVLLQDTSSIQSINETFRNHGASCTANMYTTRGFQRSNTNHSSICAVCNRSHLIWSPVKALLLCYKIAYNRG